MKYYLIVLLLSITLFAQSQSTLPRYSNNKSQKLKLLNKSISKSLFPSIKDPAYFDTAMQFFQNNVISYNDSLSNIALYSELANDNFWAVRVSVGVTLAYPKTDTNTVQMKKFNRNKFVQRFSTGGGSLTFNFALPVFVVNKKNGNVALTLSPRFSIEPPSFGVTSGKFAHNTAFGGDLQADLVGLKDVFKFYGTARMSYVLGNSAFYDALLLTGDERKGFFFNNYTIGVNVKDIFTLSYTKFWGSRNVRDKLSQYLSFTVEPGL